MGAAAARSQCDGMRVAYVPGVMFAAWYVADVI
jgi:hypothetical protein